MKIVKIIAKFALAFGILFYLIKNGKMDFSLLEKSMAMKTEWAMAFGLLISIVFVGAYRWRMLLEIEAKQELPYFEVLKMTWIGLLFNTVLPGAVTGDLIKVIYARKLDETFSKTYLITTTLIDRILGLFGLLTLLGISSCIFYKELVAKSAILEKLIHFNLLVFFGMLCFLMTMNFPKKWQEFIKSLSLKIPLVGTTIEKVFISFWTIGKDQKAVWLSVGVSIITHSLSIYAFWTLASPFFENPIPLKYGYTFIPLGLASTAVPITPSGLGLGHAIFGKLFSLFGTNNGQSLFNFYFITLVSVNLLGFFPYLLVGGDKLKEMKESEA